MNRQLIDALAHHSRTAGDILIKWHEERKIANEKLSKGEEYFPEDQFTRVEQAFFEFGSDYIDPSFDESKLGSMSLEEIIQEFEVINFNYSELFATYKTAISLMWSVMTPEQRNQIENLLK